MKIRSKWNERGKIEQHGSGFRCRIWGHGRLHRGPIRESEEDCEPDLRHLRRQLIRTELEEMEANSEIQIACFEVSGSTVPGEH